MHPVQERKSESSLSWNQVKNFKKMIDRYKLKELARIPFILWIICQTLPSIIKTENEIPTRQKRPSSRFLIEFFVNRMVKSALQKILSTSTSSGDQEGKHLNQQKEEDRLYQLLRRLAFQAQCCQLTYSHESLDTMPEIIHNTALLSELYPFVQFNNKLSRIQFRCAMLRDFFVAKSIEEEIADIGTYQPNENIELPNELFLNQVLLSFQVSLFLLDSINHKRVKTNHLLNIVQFLRKKQLAAHDANNSQEQNHFNLALPFSIALSNTMTILNATGYNFSFEDFSNICIPGANLSYGFFESTIFTYANLQGVDFTGARLKNANFSRTNMANTEFSENFPIEFKDEKVSGIACSPDGKYLAVNIGKEAAILENVGTKASGFKEIMRLQGNFLPSGKSPFSVDGKQVVTIITDMIIEEAQPDSKKEKSDGESDSSKEKRKQYSAKSTRQEKQKGCNFCLWEVDSGQLVRKFDVTTEERTELLYCDFDKGEVIMRKSFMHSKTTQKSNVATDSWSILPLWDKVKNCDSCEKCSNLLLLGDDRDSIILCDRRNGKAIHRHSHQTAYCRLSSDGKQIVTSTNDSSEVLVLDSVRNCIIKYISYQCDEDFDFVEYEASNSFCLNNNQLISATNHAIIFLDVADATLNYETNDPEIKKGGQIDSRGRFSRVFRSISQKKNIYSTIPGTKSIAFLKAPKIISIIDISRIDYKKLQPLRGLNSQGLILEGTNVNGCVALSQENFIFFKNKGHYENFNQRLIRQLLPQNQEEEESVRDIIQICQGMTVEQAKILGSGLQWKNLQKLDLSRNIIADDGGEEIGRNKSWVNLEELILSHSEIGDRTATAVAKNKNWNQLKTLQLSSNKISDLGAVAIGECKIWINLEILDLQENEIGNSGALTIGCNDTWKYLIGLDLSRNKISAKKILAALCCNNAWKNIKRITLEANPVGLQENDALHLIESTVYESLEVLKLPDISLDQNLLRSLKCVSAEKVSEISIRTEGENNINLVSIANNTTWSNLKRLDLSENQIDDKRGKLIGANNYWINLEEIDLSQNSLRRKSGIAVGRNKMWNKLRVLNLNGNEIGSEGVYWIGKNTSWSKLQILDLGGNYIESKGAVVLGENKIWSDLQILNLSINKIDNVGVTAISLNTTWKDLLTLNLYNNNISVEGAAALVRNISWVNLQILNLGRNSIGDEGTIELGQNTIWTKMQVLILTDNNISEKGAAGLGRNESWTNLQTLDLNFNKINQIGAAELVRNKSRDNLQRLDFSRTEIGSIGAAELSENITWTYIKILSLARNSIDDKGASALGRNISWVNLQILNLGHNPIGDKGVAELSQNTTWTNLQSLILKVNSINAEGVAELSKNTTWTNLQTLNLSRNSIGEEGAIALSKNAVWIKLQSLNLKGNNITAKGAKTLSKNKVWRDLQTLKLCDNYIDSAGAKALSKNATWTNLQKLDLKRNYIGDEGATKLSKNATWVNLKVLNLILNSIGEEGASALSKNSTWTNLHTLYFSSNKAGSEGIAALKNNPAWKNLQKLTFNHNPTEYLDSDSSSHSD